ncbi:uncharacterized protein LOC125674239 [Ostrea edulis]|uniref:uncharacterized protein LOC125674239 n=1 Tax=Ostrea edulis TaxID=37623 RepID=UPI0024AE9090|nr:uncharacterized protein LOC125674239 [Ostrea edulis]
MTYKPSVLALVMVGLTFSLWTIAMVTPGWLVFYMINELYPQGMEAALSIFYYTTCFASSICETESLSSSKEDHSSKQLAKMPHTLEIQLEACFALIVCGAGFIKLLLVNMSALPTSSQIVTSGILVFVGVASEATLVGRMIAANVNIKNAFTLLLEMSSTELQPYQESYRLDVPYSIIIALLGVVTGIISCFVLISFFCRNRNSPV